MEVKNAVIFGGVLLGALLIYKNRERNNARRSDAVSDDLSNNEARIALELYQIMNPTYFPGVGWTTSVLKSNYEKAGDILNTCLKITDWKGTKEKFKQLCDGTFTLTNALSSSLNTDFYNLALEIAAAKKVITTKECKVSIIEKNNGVTTITRIDVGVDTLVGALCINNNDNYTCYNGYRGLDLTLEPDRMIEYLANVNASDVKLV